jgi:hypothetical protein
VRIGRLQVFNNWSPALVADPRTIWLGPGVLLPRGRRSVVDGRRAFLDFAAANSKDRPDRPRDVLDGTVVRVPKAYPAYFGDVREFGGCAPIWTNSPNLYPVGRNGMHRYNNQDHSMLAALHHAGKVVLWTPCFRITRYYGQDNAT